MSVYEDAIDYVTGLWAMILLFVTFPLWGVPYVIYRRVTNRRKG